MADTFIRHTRRRSIPNLFSRQSGTDHDLFCRTIIKPPAAQNKCDADPISSFNSFSNLAIPHGRADRTTDEATSHSAKPQSAGQAAGYSHSTDKTTSHPTKQPKDGCQVVGYKPVSYTHLRAHETRHDLVCRLLLEKKKNNTNE